MRSLKLYSSYLRQEFFDKEKFFNAAESEMGLFSLKSKTGMFVGQFSWEQNSKDVK